MKRAAPFAVVYLIGLMRVTSADSVDPTESASTVGSSTATVGTEVTVETICNAITPEQMELFGIERVEWKTSEGPIAFPHCKILSSVSKGVSVFSAGYKLTDFKENIPTAAISRIACTPTTRVAHMVVIPGSTQDWTSIVGANAFAGLGGASSGCIAVTTAAHPSARILEGIGGLDALYSPSNSGWDYVTGHHAITQNTTEMMRILFFDVLGVPEDHRLTGCIGISLGAGLGFQLMDDWMGLTCDGMLLSVAGDGEFPVVELRRAVCAGDGTIPLTGQVPAFSCRAADLANGIGLFDKEFRQEVLQVLDTQGEEA